MKEMSKYRVINVPKLLIDNYETMQISPINLISVIKIISLNQDLISVAKLVTNDLINREAIGELLESEIFETQDVMGELMIDVNSLYRQLEKIAQKPLNNKDVLNAYVTQIISLLHRDLSKKELLIVDEWLVDHIDLDLISDAIMRAKEQNIDNLEYIDKIVRQNNLRK